MNLNPFRKQNRNPLDALSEDDLRAARKKLEFARERIYRQVRELEAQKSRLLQEGAQNDLRVRRDKAYQVLTVEEQTGQLDHQLKNVARELQFIQRIAFLKQNSAQVGKLVIDELLGKVDTSVLRGYIEELEVRGAAGSDRLAEVIDMFNRGWDEHELAADDPELGRVLGMMEDLALPPVPDVPGAQPQPQQNPAAQEPGAPS